MIRRLLVVGLFGFLALPAWAEPSATVSLETALEAARKHSPSSREQAARLDKAQWQKFRADYAWAPKVQSTFVFSVVPSEAEIDDFASNLDRYLDVQFGPYLRNDTKVVVPLYTFNRIGIAQDLAELGVDVARLQQLEAAMDLEYQVRRAYFALQLSTAYEGLLKEGSDIVKPKLKEIEDDREFGESTVSTKDFRKLQIFDAEFDVRVLDNGKLGDVAREGLRYFTGLNDIEVEPLADDRELEELKDFETYFGIAKQNRPDLRMLRAAAQARGLAVDKATADFFPNLVFAATFGFGVTTENLALAEVCRKAAPGAECVDTADLYARPYSNPLDFLSFNVGLGLEWNIDVVQAYGKKREADAELAETKAQVERASGAIELDVRRLHVDAVSALEKVHTNTRRLEAARRWRDQFGLSLQSAGGDIADGIDPLKAYFEARAALLQAQFEYQVARAALAKGIGVASLE